jgi:hypothetical protein
MDESDSDEEEREYNDVFATRVLEKVKVEAPPPTRDPYDDNGLFYGRGRDLYVGPQAAVNE